MSFHPRIDFQLKGRSRWFIAWKHSFCTSVPTVIDAFGNLLMGICNIAMRSISDGAALRLEKRKEVKNNRIMQGRCGPVSRLLALVMATGIISTATFLVGMK